jgi:hypothetical protein
MQFFRILASLFEGLRGCRPVEELRALKNF